MSAFEVSFELGDGQGRAWRTLRALVDTGSTYTWVPSPLLEELGIEPAFTREFLTAGGRVVRRDMAAALARLNGQTLPTLVVFGDAQDAALLGVVTLEEFSLGVDPVNERLIPVRGLAMGH